MHSNLPKVKVFFRWACENVQRGEEVRIVGDCEALGSWNASDGFVLERDSDEAGCWTSKGLPLPLGRRVQYKYVICNKVDQQILRWEPREDNRTVLPTGRRMVQEDDEGRYRFVPVAPSFSRQASVGFAMEASPADCPTTPGLPRLQSFEEKVRKEEEAQNLTSADIVFAVFRTLPVHLVRSKEDGKWTVEVDKDTITFKVVSLVQKSVPRGAHIKFVGHPGVFTNDTEEQKKIIEALAPYNCIPVFIDEDVVSNTLAFCHSFLWPVMHNMKVFDDETAQMQEENQETSQKFDESLWKNYQVFNRTYAETIEVNIVQGALVWVHDFYLLLVPRSLRLRRPESTVGFFLHSAFPSSEVMRCIPTREEILQSMLSCKVVTFQIFEYARHFLSCCQLLLNATYYFQGTGVLHIEHDSEAVVVRADHFVLPFADFVVRVDKPYVREQAQAIRAQFGQKMLFAAIDGDEPFSGMILKLRAFQKFLQDCPQHRNRVALLQHVLARRGNNSDSELMREVKRMTDETNRDFGQPGQPAVVVRDGDVTVDDRLAILQAADVLLDTSINDGLNLHPFMFCIAHSKDSKGSMLVSEFCGCSSVLIGATKVNPWNTQAVMDAMHGIVTMDEAERDRRFQQDHTYVSTQRLSEWVRQNLAELKQVKDKCKFSPVRGLGAGARLLSMERGFRHLTIESVLHDYRNAKTRAIFLDNEGTLAPDRRYIIRPYGAQEELRREGQPLDPQVVECLQSLANDRSNTVMVISGRGRSYMDRWFGDVKDIGLCAEHGFYHRNTTKDQQWHCIKESSDEDDDWKAIAKKVMQMYVKRVQGSVLESKGSAVAWNYRKVGAQQLANEIAQELSRYLDPRRGAESLMYGYPVEVVNGKGYVEVKRADVDKGVAVNRVLQELREQIGGQIDFVLCIGDDRSDEDMFDVVNELAKEANGENPVDIEDDNVSEVPCGSPKTARSSHTSNFGASSGCPLRLTKKASLTLEEFNPADFSKSSNYYTVTVGRKPSKAGYFVKDVGEVSELLQKLALQARVTKLSRFQSMPMLARSENGDSD
mmetsp:Transcript_56123/g.142910  ORF Transcript_56123/g.142910 Transcript_56123/m.142910 type:complete len:1050 (-) Transcript_56123:81-3230(-)